VTISGLPSTRASNSVRTAGSKVPFGSSVTTITTSSFGTPIMAAPKETRDAMAGRVVVSRSEAALAKIVVDLGDSLHQEIDPAYRVIAHAGTCADPDYRGHHGHDCLGGSVRP